MLLYFSKSNCCNDAMYKVAPLFYGIYINSKTILIKFFVMFNPNIVMFNPNCPGGRHNPDFSGTKPPLNLRPVCKFKFVRFGPVEKNQSALSFSV